MPWTHKTDLTSTGRSYRMALPMFGSTFVYASIARGRNTRSHRMYTSLGRREPHDPYELHPTAFRNCWIDPIAPRSLLPEREWLAFRLGSRPSKAGVSQSGNALLPTRLVGNGCDSPHAVRASIATLTLERVCTARPPSLTTRVRKRLHTCDNCSFSDAFRSLQRSGI